MSFLFHHPRKMAAAAIGTLSLLLSGCASVANIGDPVAGASSNATKISGSAHGGFQSIQNATITLYKAGTAMGTATAVATTTTAADSLGSWNISYTCPDNSMMYVVLSGGTATGNAGAAFNNSAIELVAVAGPCQAITGNITINEATTVAAAYAYAQYMKVTPYYTGSASYLTNASTQGVLIGADPVNSGTIGTSGFSNAFLTLKKMVQPYNGEVLTSFNPGAVVGATMTGTLEATKFNAIANILGACVNQTSAAGGACDTLFTGTTTPAADV